MRTTNEPRRRVGAIAGLVGLVAVVLTGCHEISVDYSTRQATSEASSAITPTTMVVGGQEVPAIDIALRYCDTIQVTGVPSEDGPATLHLGDARPTASILDEHGTLVFDSFLMWNTYPGNAQVIDSTDPEVTDHLLVPVAGFRPPFIITTGCTTYAGHGSLPSLGWFFDPCLTSNGTCAPTTAGHISQSPSSWLWNEGS